MSEAVTLRQKAVANLTEARAILAAPHVNKSQSDKAEALIDEATDLEYRAAVLDRDVTRQGELDEIVARHSEFIASKATGFGGADHRPTTTTEYRDGDWLAGQLQTRGLTTGSGAGSVFSPAENAGFFLDRLAAQSVAFQTGINMIKTGAKELAIPHLTADSSSAWVSEGATISASDPSAETTTATPRKLAALIQLTNEVIRDSEPAVLGMVEFQVGRSLALKWDLGFFEGSGSAPEIRGLKNVSGIGTISMGTNGGSLSTLDQFATAIGDLATQNAEANAIVMHPRTWTAVTKLKETSSSNKPLVTEGSGSPTSGVRRSIYGVPVFLSSQLSITETQGSASNASSVYVFDSSKIWSVLRTEVEIELDRSRLFNSDQSELRAIWRADVVVPDPECVVRILGVTPGP